MAAGRAGVMNIGRLLTQTAARFPDGPGIVWRDRTWRWAEVEARSNALAAGLRALGVGKGDKVLAIQRNSNQLIEVTWACFKLGAVWVPVNARLTPSEIAGLAQTSEAAAVVYDARFAAHVDAARALSPGLATIVAVCDARTGEHSLEALITAHSGAPAAIAEVAYDDPLWFFFTSGTTGRPKAAILTHGQMAFVIANHLADLTPDLSQRSASLVVAPLSHGAGIHALLNVARGAASVLMPGDSLDPEQAWRLVERHRVDNMFTVPTIVKRLVEHDAVDRYDHSSLRWVVYAGAPMYRQDQRLALRKLGRVLVQYFGLGEVTGNITVLPPEMHSETDGEMRAGTCGFARTGMEIAIEAADGAHLPAGEQGEICARGPAVCAGYYNDPAATAKALRGGWFHTGDLGYLDVAGFLYITGRGSDMYISGGSNVYPREVEEALLSHPGVSEAAVLGVADPDWGETGVAVVVRAPGPAVAAAALLAHLDGKVARYKIPRHVVFWDALPKSGYGKVPKHLIRDELFDRGDLARPAPEK